MPHFNPGVLVDDDGSFIGRFQKVDFADNLTVTVVDGVAVIDASGGGGGSGSITTGLLSARPAAGPSNTGSGYYADDVDLFYISNGTIWITMVLDHGTALTGLSDDDHPQYVLRSIATTKGDLIVRDASGLVRLPVGTDDLPLVADSSDAKGLAYKALPQASVTSLVTDLAAKMAKAQNLADVASVPSSKTNLKVGYAVRSYSHANFR